MSPLTPLVMAVSVTRHPLAEDAQGFLLFRHFQRLSPQFTTEFLIIDVIDY